MSELFTLSDLINHLIKTHALTTPSIIKSFHNIDRREFVGTNNIPMAYHDSPLSIGYSQTISQPTTVAHMLEWLQPQEGEAILDIGSGSGWTTTLLADSVGPTGTVLGLERSPELVKFGNNNLNKYSFSHAKIEKASSSLGKENTKFNRILVSAAAPHFTPSLLDQLFTNGTLVIPIKHAIHIIKKTSSTTYNETKHEGYSFVPLHIES